MLGKETRHHLPLVLQLLQRHEEQLAAEARQNPEEGQLFTRKSMESVDFEMVTEWSRVFLQIFGLFLISGSFLLLWIFALNLAGY